MIVCLNKGFYGETVSHETNTLYIKIDVSRINSKAPLAPVEYYTSIERFKANDGRVTLFNEKGVRMPDTFNIEINKHWKPDNMPNEVYEVIKDYPHMLSLYNLTEQVAKQLEGLGFKDVKIKL